MKVRSIAPAAALITLIALAPTASAATQVSKTGNTGVSSLAEPGGLCSYGATDQLVSIRAFKPKIFGRYTYNTWVGFRMRLLYSPDLGDAYSVVWYSAIQKDRANKNSFADGFTGIQWNRTSPYDDDGRYKFQVVAIFYKPGSKTKVDGKTIWQPEQLNAKFESEPPFLYPYDFCVAQE